MGGEHVAYYEAQRTWASLPAPCRIGGVRAVLPSDARLHWSKALRDGRGEEEWASTRYAGDLLWLPGGLGAHRGLDPEVFLRAARAAVGPSGAREGAEPFAAWHLARAHASLDGVEREVSAGALLRDDWERRLWCEAWGALVDCATAAKHGTGADIAAGFRAYQGRIDAAAAAIRAAVPWSDMRACFVPSVAP